jgi:laminin alpha 3/5
MKTLLLVALLSTARAQVEVRDPPYFNVALNKPISATATCGQLANGSAVREEVCQLTLTGTVDTTEVCDFCDASRRGDRHPIEYAVDGRLRYWQSPPLSRGQNFHEVNITIDLGQVCVYVCQAYRLPDF